MNVVESIRKRVGILTSPEVQTLFETHISRDATIVVGGPGESPQYDTGLLWASYWVSHGGKVYIADPQSTGEYPSLSESYDHKYITGAGNVAEYQAYLSLLSKSGQDLAPVTWLGPQSTLWDMPGISDGSVDHVMDHYTSIFLLHTLALPIKETKDLWKKTLSEYTRVLRPGGTLMLQSDMSHAPVTGIFQTHEEIMQQMRTFGFEVSHTTVHDRLRVPLSPEVVSALQNPWNMVWPGELRIDKSLVSFIKIHHGVSVIAPAAFYSCPDVYIGRKI